MAKDRSLQKKSLFLSQKHVWKCFNALSTKAKFAFFSVLLFQSVASVLDLVGLALITKIVIGTQPSRLSSGSASTSSSTFFGEYFNQLSTDTLIVGMVLIFCIKGSVAILLNVINVKIMASETIKLVKSLSISIFENRTKIFSNLSSQEISYAIFNATELVFRDTLVPVTIIVSDVFLLVLIGTNLFVNAHLLFLPTTFYFLMVFIVLRIVEKKTTRYAYKAQWENEILSRRLIHEATISLRELYVSSKLNYFIKKINTARTKGVRAGSSVALAQLRPKYLYEIALFGGIGVIFLVSRSPDNSESLFMNLTIFLVSSTRMIPALLRTQFYLGTLQKSTEQSSNIFEILDLAAQAKPKTKPQEETSQVSISSKIFTGSISIDNISFSYDKMSHIKNIDSITFTIKPGQSLAIVGASGAGKSTLVDLILGYLDPDEGSVKISGVNPRTCFTMWPGKVAYVPQRITIYEGTIFSNIAVGGDIENDYEARIRVKNLLEIVGLGSFLESSKGGLDMQVSEFGSNLSGGQLQRLGIARALFTDPDVLVFDESTSALDSESESFVMSAILDFKSKKTLVFIAHKLSTIKSVDKVLFLRNGRIEAQGTYSEVRGLVDGFDNQIKIYETSE